MPIFEANRPMSVRSVPLKQRLAAATTRRRCRSSDHLNDWREHFWLRQRGSAVRQAINRSVRPNRLETAARQPRMGDPFRLWRGPASDWSGGGRVELLAPVPSLLDWKLIRLAESCSCVVLSTRVHQPPGLSDAVARANPKTTNRTNPIGGSVDGHRF